MRIEKRGKNSWRVRQTENGVTYRVTVDYKPTSVQASALIAAERERVRAGIEDGTFSAAAQKHIDRMDGMRSPSTVREYTRMKKYLETNYGWFTALPVRDIAQGDVDKVIKGYASGGRSAKSIRNLHGFLSVVLNESARLTLHSVLPDRQKVEPYIPTDEEVKAVCTALRGSKYELPTMLAAFGLRRSEILPLTAADVDDQNRIHVNKATVRDKTGSWITKDFGKTPASRRTVEIPQYVADLLRAQGKAYEGYPDRLTKHLRLVQRQLGIREFGIHRLRHYYASTAISQNVPLVYIQRAGGWSTPTVLQNIYSHAMRDKRHEMDMITVNHLTGIVTG